MGRTGKNANCLQIKGRANLSMAHQQPSFLFSVRGVELLLAPQHIILSRMCRRNTQWLDLSHFGLINNLPTRLETMKL